jgi:hypothetical protein
MKSKLSIKVLGVVVTVATLASLLVGITAAPVSAAAPGALAWTTTATPGTAGDTLTSGIYVNKIAAAADGKTVFALDDTTLAAPKVYKSVNAGASWTTTPATFTPAVAAAVVGIVVSPNFATDNTIAIAFPTEVWVSTNGGSSFAAATLDLAAKLEGGAISSVDVGNYLTAPSAVSILVGVKGGAGLISNTLMWTMGTFSWSAVGNITTAGIGDFPVLTVKFSPAAVTDAEIMAVYLDGASIPNLASHYGALSLAWNAFIPSLAIGVAAVTPATTIATIAVGSDYIGNTGSAILVGIANTGSAAGNDNIWKVTGRASGAGSATNLLVKGTATNFEVNKIVVSGTTAAGTVFYTTNVAAVAPTLSRATGGTSGFTAASISKAPITATGVFQNEDVAISGSVVFASVGMTGTFDGGVYRSVDGGVSFDGVGLLDVGAGVVSLADLNVVDANNMFIILNNATAGYLAKDIFKTTDAGATWVRIRAAAAAVTILASPAYATDSTILILDGSGIVLKSVNGGSVFSSVGVPTLAFNGVMVDGTNFFVGGSGSDFFKAGRFAGATFPSGFVATIKSEALNPKDATKATISVGCSDGTVYTSTNDGVSFTQTKGATVNPSGTNAIVTYDAAGDLFVGTTAGLWSYLAGATDYIALQAGSINDAPVSADGTIYASTPAAGVGVYRSLKPTAASAAKAEFQTMNIGSSWNALFTSSDVDVVSGAAANSVYMADTSVAQNGITGGIYGFSDTLIAAAKITSPVDGTILTDPTAVTLTYPAITGTTVYGITIDTAAEVANGTNLTYAPAAGTPGSSHTWSVRVDAPLFSRASATAKYTYALTAPPVSVVGYPANGQVNVPVDATFSWTAVTGATYEFVLAEELGNVDKFAIIDYSATTPTNAIGPKETLKYNTLYWWRVRAVTATSTSAWTVSFFTTAPAPVVTTATSTNGGGTTVTFTNTSIVVTQQPATTVTFTNGGTGSTNEIPAYLLWAVVAVGAVLVISVIVLIVRTRKI